MGELLAEHGEGDAHPGEDGLGEGGADGEAVDEVVHAVAEDDHPGHRCHVVVGRVLEGRVGRVRRRDRLDVLHRRPRVGGRSFLVPKGSPDRLLRVFIDLKKSNSD